MRLLKTLLLALALGFAPAAFATSVTCTSASFANGVLTCETSANTGGGGTTGGGGGSTTPPQGEFAACPAGTTIVTGRYPAGSNLFTADLGQVGDGKTIVVKMVIPADARVGTKNNNWTNLGATGQKEYIVSTKPCDFTDANAVQFFGKPVHGQSSTDFTWSYSIGAPGSTASLIQGKTYYFTVRGLYGCTAADCPGSFTLK